MARLRRERGNEPFALPNLAPGVRVHRLNLGDRVRIGVRSEPRGVVETAHTVKAIVAIVF